MSGDIQEQLRERVLEAAAAGTPLEIVGGGTKRFLGRAPEGTPLEVGGHAGILSYEPKELVITARAGTPLRVIDEALAAEGQMLPFEPPRFGEAATLGGTVAAGLSGPRRPYAGSARDFVLGVRLLNGRGEILRFGGEVMKNVAGYDVSRLVTGAMGTLGVLLDVSLKVLPRPAAEITLVQRRVLDDAIRAMNGWGGRPIPLSAACCDGDRLYVRLSGAETAVASAREVVGGDPVDEGDAFWRDRVREQGHGFFGGQTPLWRVSVPATAPLRPVDGRWFLDWGGALRWLKSSEPPERVRQQAAAAGGHATLFRGGDRSGQVFHPLPEPLVRMHHALKRAFDPQGVFNPGRMYPDF